MEQKNIREYNNLEYSIEEGAAIVKELDLRTKHNEDGYNSISEIAGKLKVIEAAGEAVTIENEYTDIDDMLSKQNEQTPGAFQYVADATDDPRFPGNVERIYAYYEKLPTSNESTDDYRLFSTPETEEVETGYQKVLDQYNNVLEAAFKVVYGEGMVISSYPGGGYKMQLVQRPETGTLIKLTSIVPRLYNYPAPLPATSYVINSVLPGGKAKILINVDQEPAFNYQGTPCKKLSNSFDFGAGLDVPATFEVFLEFNGVDVTYFILEY